MKSRRAGIALAAAVVLLPLCAGRAQASPAPAVWMLSRTALSQRTSTISFIGSDTVYQVSDPGDDDSALTGYAIVAYHEFDGSQAASDVSNGDLPSQTNAIVLDQENWNGTCPAAPGTAQATTCTSASDLTNPIGGAATAALAVTEYNSMHSTTPLTLIVTPGLDLFQPAALGCSLGQSAANLADCYLNYDMAGKMAALPGVAVIDLQAQSLESDPGATSMSAGSYWRFVSKAASQAHAAAKSVGKAIVILAGLSTYTNTTTEPSQCQIEQSAINVLPLVSGFWMNVPAEKNLNPPQPPDYSEAWTIMASAHNDTFSSGC